MVVHEIKTMSDYGSYLSRPGGLAIYGCATWDHGYKINTSQFAELSENEKYSDKFIFVKLDIDMEPESAEELAIRSVPTFKFFKDGQLYETVSGANLPAVMAALDKLGSNN